MPRGKRQLFTVGDGLSVVNFLRRGNRNGCYFGKGVGFFIPYRCRVLDIDFPHLLPNLYEKIENDRLFSVQGFNREIRIG
jgi:hypothetical protein